MTDLKLLKFSVIIPTIGRLSELNRNLQSILNSSLLPEEIIIVDQNENNILHEIISNYNSKLNIIHERVKFKGVSKAKNYGVNVASTDYIFIPDDDCEIYKDTFLLSLTEMCKNKSDVVFGKCIDQTGNDSVTKFSPDAGWLSLKEHKGKFIEATICSKRSILQDFPFDESLGAGCFHGAEEAYDWILRLLYANKKLYYNPIIKYFHLHPVVDYTSNKSLDRVFKYRCGFAKLCKKHSKWKMYCNRFITVSLAMVAYSFYDKKKFKYYLAELCGLIMGLIIE